jgi:hypothetical protein
MSGDYSTAGEEFYQKVDRIIMFPAFTMTIKNYLKTY